MCTHKAATPAAGMARTTRAVVLGFAATLCAGAAWASPEFQQTGLISDGAVPEVQSPDPSLINPWGVSYSPTGPFWVSDNNSGL
jgi:hypothetical protein